MVDGADATDTAPDTGSDTTPDTIPAAGPGAGPDPGADLVLGPLLRHVDREAATVWVEADRPCDVRVLDATAPTFTVAGHHYALVEVDLADREEVTPYEVHLDDVLAWPRPDDHRPAPVVRKPAEARARVVFGSCRAAAPDTEPWTLPRTEHPDGLGVDALEEYGRGLAALPYEDWPDLLLMLGDQVYADDASPETRAYARSRRNTDQPPGEEVADFEEYTRLYRETWGDPEVRWLLSTVPSAMVFDDHDVIDDWNISASWLEDMRATDWWEDRIVGALVSYWVYQHLGNLSPAALADNPEYAAVRACDGDAAEVLWPFAHTADRQPDSTRWSFTRHLADTDLVVVDSRAARTLTGERNMLDETEWAWLADKLADPAPNVLVATTLPMLLPIAIHDIEGWNERVCAGAWGATAARAGEALRRAIDLEHWAAFGAAFDRMIDLLRDVRRNPAVRNLVLLSGDVHYGQVDRATWPDVDLPLWQVIASPMRQEVNGPTLRAFAAARSEAGRRMGRALRTWSGGREPAIHWDTVDGPVQPNHVAVLDLDPDLDGGGRVALWTVDRTPGLTRAVARTLD